MTGNSQLIQDHLLRSKMLALKYSGIKYARIHRNETFLAGRGFLPRAISVSIPCFIFVLISTLVEAALGF